MHSGVAVNSLGEMVSSFLTPLLVVIFALSLCRYELSLRCPVLSFIHCCVHCCVLQMSHVSFSFRLLSLSDRIFSTQLSLLDSRPMFVLVSFFLVCRPVFILLLSAAYRNVPICVSGIMCTHIILFALAMTSILLAFCTESNAFS